MNDQQQDPQSETKNMGIIMFIMAMLSGIALLTYTFEGELNRQYNPNQEIHSTQASRHQIEIILRQNRNGHYVTNGRINQQKVVFLLDTGATYVAVPEQLSQRLKLKKGRKISISTANGQSIGYQTHINKLSIGDIHLYNIKAVITPNLEEILLGMSALKQLEFTQRGKKLTIRQFI
jgi:aspartyl protease family protein